MKRKLLILLPVLFYILSLTGSFHWIAKATTASYNMTIRLVNSSSFVINGLASATSANYNATYQVVDQNGNVINPGTASTVSATPNGTIRIVDANGKVQSGFSTPAPTSSPTPTMAVPTATSTAGNVFTKAGLGSPSTTTHDMIACCIEQSTGAGAAYAPGWFEMAALNHWNSNASYLDLMGHCVQTSEPATTTFAGLNNDRSTGMGCVLINNTACGEDAVGGETNNAGSASTTLNYPAVISFATNTLLLYCAAASVTAANTTMSTNPAGLTVDVLSPGVSGTQGMFQIGHIPVAAPTTTAASTGTISSSQLSAGTVGVVAPLH